MESIRYSRGFTLLELVVVLAIITVVTGVVITSQSAFNKTLILANTAYDVALSIRSAQTYGLGSRAAGITTNSGYGIHFAIGTPSNFTLFADTYPAPSETSVCHPTDDASSPSAQTGNCAYDSNQGEQVITYTMGNRISMSDLCAYAGGWSCGLTSLDIVFTRPNPDPFISENGVYDAGSPVTRACITLTSPQGGAEYVMVEASGAISANAPSCP
jgi:prepilin-type N-terminal cleavage/methylation domain-containing protein